MNTWQVCRQLAYLLRSAAWPSGGERVFGDVVVTQAPVEALLGKLRPPAALIRVGGAVSDDDVPSLLTEELEVALVASSVGDEKGQAALLGAARSSGQTSSKGRGLLELEEELFRAAAILGGASGVRLNLTAKTGGQALLDGTTLAASRGYAFRARTSAYRSYPAPTLLVATPTGSGNVSLTWSVPPARYDRLNVVLRRAAGSTAPTSVSDGTGVTLASALATSVTDSPGAGTFSYALFAGYDETSATPTTADRHSSSVTRTGVVVT